MRPNGRTLFRCPSPQPVEIGPVGPGQSSFAGWLMGDGGYALSRCAGIVPRSPWSRPEAIRNFSGGWDDPSNGFDGFLQP